jgi:hypothetical protein
MSCSRHRIPAKPEPRKAKGKVSKTRVLNQIKGKLFNAGLYAGKSGRVLTNYVTKVLRGIQTA